MQKRNTSESPCSPAVTLTGAAAHCKNLEDVIQAEPAIRRAALSQLLETVQLARCIDAMSTEDRHRLFTAALTCRVEQPVANAILASITSLNLSYSKISMEDAFQLASALKTNTSLTSLILCRNQIGDQGA